MMIRHGATRTVFLTKNYAIKIPTILFTGLWRCGRQSNIRERQLSGTHKDLCPVIWGDPFGLMIVMPRAVEVDLSVDWLEMLIKLNSKYKDDPQLGFIMSDYKPSNWGYLDGTLVKIDYG